MTSTNPVRSGDQPQQSAGAKLVVAAVVSALLTSHAFDLGRLGLWAADRIFGVAETQERSAMEAGLILIGVGFIVATLLSIRRRHISGESSQDLVVAAAVGLVGATFTVIDKTWDEAAGTGIGQPGEDTAPNLLYVFVVAVLFVAPAVLRLRGRGDGVTSFYAALCLTIITGLVATGLVQVAHLLARTACADACLTATATGYGRFDDPKTAFFLFAPMATGGLLAPWALLAIDPAARPDRWGRPSRRVALWWLSAYALCAVLLIAAALFLFEYRDHFEFVNGVPKGWMAKAGLDEATAVLHPLLLSAPALAAVLAAFGFGWLRTDPEGVRSFWRKATSADWRALLLGFAAGAAGALACALLLAQFDTNISLSTGVEFVIAHGLAAAATVLAVQVGLLTK